jgi:hypothetical protein
MKRSVSLVTAVLLLVAILAAGCSAAPAPSAQPSLTAAPQQARLDLQQARSTVKAWLAKEVPDYNLDTLSDLAETDFGIDGLYETTGMQFYLLNCYLYSIYGGEVSRTMFLTPLAAVTADVDGDGRSEAVLLGDIGSGRSITVLFLAKDGVIYQETVENNAGDCRFTLGMMDDGKIAVIRIAPGADGTSNQTVVGTVSLRQGKAVIDKADIEQSVDVQTTWSQAMPEGIPEPPGVKRYVQTRWGLQCQGISPADFANYKQRLVQSGFRLVENSDDINFTYSNGSQMLYITDQSSVSPGGYIALICSKLKTDAGLQPGELTLKQAAIKINEYLAAIKDKDDYRFGKSVRELTHTDISGAWDKMKLQGFSSTDTGDFIIQDGKVASAFMLGNTVVADIDSDGDYELYTIAGFGSGIYRIMLSACQHGEFFSSTSWIPSSGFEFGLQKIDDYTVKLRGVRYIGDQIEFTDDYGKLSIQTVNGVRMVVPEKEPGKQLK